MDAILLKLSVMLVPALLAIVLHEVAHGYAADRLGDPTARLLGRLTLNPLRHLDPIGTLAIFLVGFGWARPVPVQSANLRRPHTDMIWVAFAGPLMNFVLALLAALLLRGLGWLAQTDLMTTGLFQIVQPPLVAMASFAIYINLLLCLFNLIPIPPLDGGRILLGLMPEAVSLRLRRFEHLGFILLLLLVFGTDLWSYTLSPLLGRCIHLLAGDQAQVMRSLLQSLLR